MAVIDVPLELIDDNPYNPRKHYPQAKVKEMAQSLREVGLRQVPEGRHVDGRCQLAYGHMRLRGFLQNQKHDPYPANEKWKRMPVDAKEISDQDMFHYAMEENLRRTDITPIELARCIEAFSEMFPDVTEKEIGAKHSMTEAHVSNMRRVLRLPEKILEKIDEGRINFTQGRELIILEKLENSEELMLTAIRSLKTEARPYGHPNTVEGMQQGVHDVAGNHCRPLDKQWEGYHWDILFDTRAAGCLDCKQMIRTHPTKSATAHWCLDEKCWENKQEEHRQKASATAKAQMEEDILRQAAQVITQEEKAPPPTPVMIDEHTVLVDQETLAKLGSSNSCEPISEGAAVRRPVELEGKLYLATSSGMGKVEAYQLVPREEFTGEVRTYRVPPGREYDEYYEFLRNDPNGFYHGMLVKRGQVEHVLVGPEVTFVTKVDEGDFSQEKLPGQVEAADETDRFLETVAAETEAQVREGDRQMEEARERANLERPVGELPCETCTFGNTCDRSNFTVSQENGDNRYICDQWEPDQQVPRASAQAVPEGLLEQEISQRIAESPAPAPQEIPEDILALAREKAGTRAEVIDVNDIVSKDYYRREVKSGYTVLKGWWHDELDFMDDPEECTERCTHGFHFGFDSKDKEGKVFYICTDTKCAAKKKAAFTRAKNAEGQARKKAEAKAIKEAISQTMILDQPRVKLILLAQMDGLHASRTYYYGTEGGIKKPETWLWDKVSAGTPALDRTRAKLFKAIDKLSGEELAKLVVEFMFYYLTDKGDIGTHEIKAAEPLKWMGVTIQTETTGGEGSD